jgi:hypothetical protein
VAVTVSILSLGFLRSPGLIFLEIGAEAPSPRLPRRRKAVQRHRSPVRLSPDALALWTWPPDDADFLTRWRLIKARLAKVLPKQERLSGVRRARGDRDIWQRRFWEHLIRDEAGYARHVEYCFIDPTWSPACGTGRIHRFTATSGTASSLSMGRARLKRQLSSENASEAPLCRAD